MIGHANGLYVRATRMLVAVVLSSAAVLCLLADPYSAKAAEYVEGAAVFDLGMGARPLALGGAYTGFAVDVNALYYNPAGLARQEGFTVASTYEQRLLGAGFGSLGLCVPPFGVGVQYLRFKDIPEIDDTGAVTGVFDFSAWGFSVSAGIGLQDLLSGGEVRGGRQLAAGIRLKAYTAATVEAASGAGASFDVSLLFGGELSSVSSGEALVAGMGVVIENIASRPITFSSGHEEDWPLEAVFGGSLEIPGWAVATVDVATCGDVGIGLEVTPADTLALRIGARYEGLWMWSVGAGAQADAVRIDLAYVNHGNLGPQLRGSFAIRWQPGGRLRSHLANP